MRRRMWVPEEDEALKTIWGKEGVESDDLLKIFNGRTMSSITNRAIRLGLKAWTKCREPDINKDYLRKLLEVVEG